MGTIKVLIVDDHPMMRRAMQVALTEEEDMQVVGEAVNGADAVRKAAELAPDVIIMDLLMSGMDGLKAMALIFAANPQTRILVSTSLEAEEKVLAAIQAGALGYFSKSAPRSAFVGAVRQVATGAPYLPPEIAMKLFKGIRENKAAATLLPGDEAAKEPLTSRQREILRLLGEGRSDQEIGQLLCLSEATVRSHVHRILQRLGLENRAQVIAYANRAQGRIGPNY